MVEICHSTRMDFAQGSKQLEITDIAVCLGQLKSWCDPSREREPPRSDHRGGLILEGVAS